ncbi:Gfo/Idh/MocA family protein [Paenibacillus sp. HJGM_3]|uniref:Gfo/Idh/MocA family protein n=1 Tax=Paenibacillus sp. HJGM_3 TaxID=3379816 RepID=UPI00385CA34C
MSLGIKLKRGEPMGSKIKLGIVGCGMIAQHHLKHAMESEHILVTAVADIREQAARSTADKFGIPTVYTDPDELFANPEIEGVVLALQTKYRTELALKAFAQGKHVLLEKPAGMNAEEVRRMIEVRGELIAGCCSSRFRFFDSARAAAEFIQTGALGDIRVIRCRNIAPAAPPNAPPLPWQYSRTVNGGGVLADWGVYDLDYILGILGWTLQPETVYGRKWNVAPPYESYIAPESDAETHVVAMIGCSGGAVIHFERGAMIPGNREHAWQIVGTKGTLDLYLLPSEEKEIVFHEAVTEEGVVRHTIWKGADTWSGVHAGPISDFAASIRDRRQPGTNLENAWTIQSIIDSIYASSDTGKLSIIAGRTGGMFDEH